MKVSQVYEIVNTMAKEILGESAVVNEDLTNVVDIGREIFDTEPVDNFVRKLLDHIGKVVFVNRPYTGRAPSVLMDGWEFGSILEKIDAGVPEAELNPKWNLQDGETYNQDTFKSPQGVTAKFWNDKVTFQVFMSFADDQVKSAFSNATQLNAFFSMIYTKIDTAFTIRLDGLIMATIDNFAATVYLNGSKGSYNLLDMYKKINPSTTITAANCIYDLDFLKFAAMQMKLFSNRLTNASTMFNIGGRVRHTPKDMQKIVMLDMFANAADVYLQSDTFHNEFVAFPNSEKISYWQGTGTGYSFDDISTINVAVKWDNETRIVNFKGVLAVIFDRDALGVNNFNRRVTNHYNAPGEFVNNWYKMDAQYFNDFNENFVLFYVQDPATMESKSKVA